MNTVFDQGQLELLIEDGSPKGSKQLLKDLKEDVTGDEVKEIVEAVDSLIEHPCKEAVVINRTRYFA